MKVIDFRFRPNTAENLSVTNSVFKGMCDAAGFKAEPMELDDIIAGLNEHEVVKAVVEGRDAETTYNFKVNNDGIVDLINKYPNNFVGFAGLDPHKGMAAIKELTRTYELGLRGASIDPYLAHIYVNDAKYYPIYAKCCELDIPIVISTGPATLVDNAVIDHVAPRYIDFVARDFPELKIIAGHGCYPWVNEMITVAQRNKNVFFDISEYESFPQSEYYVKAANTIISDKLIFSSANPFQDYKQCIKIYQNMGFTKETLEKVMYTNAAHILKLGK